MAGWFENIGAKDTVLFAWRGEIITREIPHLSRHSTSPQPVASDAAGKLGSRLESED